MTLNELIDDLKKLYTEHGDVEVYREGDLDGHVVADGVYYSRIGDGVVIW